ncbi:MAG: polysaccharide pyruvyl transferase family protein [Thermoanaerobaculia bacterium]
MKKSRPVVGVFGHYGNRNLGDESIIEAAIAQIRRRLPNAEICCFSLRPDDSARRHRVESYRIGYAPDGFGPITPEQAAASDSMPWHVYEEKLAKGLDPDNYSLDPSAAGLKERVKRLPLIGGGVKVLIAAVHRVRDAANELGYLTTSYTYLKKFDLLVVAGSNQFLDNFGGPWHFPYTLFKWTLLAKLTGTRIAFVSVGANPLEHALSKRMIRGALRLADYISYRDEASKSLIEAGNTGFSGEVYPDLAFGLEYQRISPKKSRFRPLVGINPMPVYDYRYWCVSDDDQYHAYVFKVARFAERLIEADYPVLFFGTMWFDDYVIVDILQEMNPEIADRAIESPLVRRCEEVSELIQLLQDTDIVVATRFHGAVLPLLVQTPVLGIGYYRKNHDLMSAFGQSDYYEVLERFDVDRLWEKLLALSRNCPQEKKAIKLKAAEYRQLTEEQWDRIVGLIV